MHPDAIGGTVSGTIVLDIPEMPQPTSSPAALLDRMIGLARRTDAGEMQDLLHTLIGETLRGNVRFHGNLTQTIDSAIAAIDSRLSRQLAEIMHKTAFLELEGSWRGLHHLVTRTDTGQSLKIRVLNITKRQLLDDLTQPAGIDRSLLFEQVHTREFGMLGGEPYCCRVGDYRFSRTPRDIELLRGLAAVAAASLAPLISAAEPELVGCKDFRELQYMRDLGQSFEAAEFAPWRSFRDSDDARFVVLTLPRVLARLPCGDGSVPVEAFDYQEGSVGTLLDHGHYCWMNAAYLMAARLTHAASTDNWCTAIHGVHGGGMTHDLPVHAVIGDHGDADYKGPAEVALNERREWELARLGFLPLCNFKGTDSAAFFCAQTAHRPRTYEQPAATADAAIAGRLPCVMASSRFIHYLKVICRDRLGAFMERADVEGWLNHWISRYVSGDTDPDPETKARLPLREAHVSVTEISGAPGHYRLVAHLRPWLPQGELTAPVRVAADLPSLMG